MSAWVIDSTGTRTDGNADTVPPGMNWAFVFPVVASGAATLHVYGSAPGFAPRDQPCSIVLQ
jgi:hypothetical protein